MLIDGDLTLPLVGRVCPTGRGGGRPWFNQYTDTFFDIGKHEITPTPDPSPKGGGEEPRSLVSFLGLIPQ
jgi:hypothetical protein